MNVDNLDYHESMLISFAINRFGLGVDSGHPIANPKNLEYFGPEYGSECLGKLSMSMRVNPVFRRKAKKLKDELGD